MKLDLPKGATSRTVHLFIQDVRSTSGGGLTGLVFNTSGLTAYYVRPRGTPTAITLATLAAVTSAWNSGGFKELDSTNMPGWYRFDVPDECLADGADHVGIHIRGAANMVPLPLEIQLTNQMAAAEGIYLGTVASGSDSTHIVDSGLTQSGTDHWKGRIVIFITGSLKYQATDITAFDPATDKLTVSTLTAGPSNGDLYVVV